MDCSAIYDTSNQKMAIFLKEIAIFNQIMAIFYFQRPSNGYQACDNVHCMMVPM